MNIYLGNIEVSNYRHRYPSFDTLYYLQLIICLGEHLSGLLLKYFKNNIHMPHIYTHEIKTTIMSNLTHCFVLLCKICATVCLHVYTCFDHNLESKMTKSWLFVLYCFCFFFLHHYSYYFYFYIDSQDTKTLALFYDLFACYSYFFLPL